MTYLVISEIEEKKDINDKNGDRKSIVVIDSFKTVGFTVGRDINRDSIGEISCIGIINDFIKFRDNERGILHKWTRDSYESYLKAFIIERKIKKSDVSEVNYCITGLEECFITDFSEEYSEGVNTFSLQLKQRGSSAIGVIDIERDVLNELDEQELREKSGLKEISKDEFIGLINFGKSGF